MLHVFSVNRGQMMTFDVAMAMDKVVNLKKIIGSKFSVDPNTQVMLVNGGQELEDSINVGGYAAGTETNPIYVYDRSLINEKSIHIHKNYRVEDMSDEIEEAYVMPPNYDTVYTRTKLALRINEATQNQAHALKSVIRDLQLMFNGWKNAMANLSETHRKFQLQIASTHKKCTESLAKLSNHEEVLEGMEEIIELLSQIKLLPVLILDNTCEVTLLSWIESRCGNLNLAETLNESREKLARLKQQQKLNGLLEACYAVTSVINQDQRWEIPGLNNYRRSLEYVMNTAKENMQEQRQIVKGFVKNKETLDQEKSSLTRDALVMMCESHERQLKLMQKKESETRASLMQCDKMKADMAAKLNVRLKWLYTVQHHILVSDTNLSLFRDQLDRTLRYIEFFAQVKKAPELYFSSVHECVRRKAFSRAFKQWGDNLLTTSSVARDKEITLRKSFKASIGQHFIKKLFPGFSDRPPAIAKRPLKSFDTELPEISESDADSLAAQFPQFKQPEMQMDSLPDPSQLSWQLVYSTSTKATLQASNVTSQHPSITSSVDSTTSNLTESKMSQTADFFKGLGQEDKHPSSEVFSVSSIQKMNDDENDDNVTVKNFSPPPFSTIAEVGVGSPESGEFFTMPPFLETDKMQSLLAITPPDTDTKPQTISISGNKLTTHSSRLATQSQLTSSSTSDDEMFHSIGSEMEKNHLVLRLREAQSENDIKDEEIKKLKKKYSEEISCLQLSRDEMASTLDRRLAESRNELDSVLDQLAREREERRQAWEKESQTTKELEQLQGNHSILNDEINDLKKEISVKNRLISEMHTQMAGLKSVSEMKIAEVEQKSERDMWSMKQSYETELANMTETIKNLKRVLKDTSSDLASAEDRIQELETQVSDAENKIVAFECSVATSAAEIEILQKDVATKQEIGEETATKLVESESLVAEVKLELDRQKETVGNLKGMLAEYEVDLDDMRISNKLLQSNQVELDDIRLKNEELERNLKQSESNRLDLGQEVSKLQQELSENKIQLKEHETTMKTKLEESQNHYEKVILEIKEEMEQKNKDIFEANKQRTVSLKSEQDDELVRIKETYQCEMNKLKQDNSRELDEMRADYLAEIMEYQQKLSELQKLCDDQADAHKQELNELRSNHEKCVKNLSLELNSATTNNSILQNKIDQWCVMNTSVHDSVLSSTMSSSNEETYSKRTRMDDEMMTSYKSELEKEKQALQISFKKKEEAATKRRQIVFNSAIQRLTSAKDAEIERLKQQMAQNESMLSSVISQSSDLSSASSSRVKEKEKVIVSNFQPDDIVLITYDPHFCQYMMVTPSHSLYFLHNDSVAQFDLKSPGPNQSKQYSFARFLEKEYCLARKPSNRFRVEVGTKFYRVKVAALSKPRNSS